ncbi:low choriolytic enzyme-like [Cydia pomonella]|uniref:low choriolytic enzyme-like n=1 Tax=Cydia pomonella TaxID=82600 RepID=UPI002ADDD8AA|nr:low choriolytic enzyme-like [Cydia pomonella]
MLWRVSIYILFLFYYTGNGQIQLVPIVNGTANVKKLLGEDQAGSIKTLKAKRPENGNLLLPSQWALGPEGTPRWPNGEIKVYIDSDSYGDGIAGRVLDTLNKFQSHDGYLCPQVQELKEKPTEPVGSWLHITNPDRVRPCVHDAGVDDNGEIKVVLGYDCLKPREILHTILHGLGFRDEVTHPQRDLFVRVMWENIQPAFRSMFRIQSVETNDAGLMEYDPMSVMHFHDRAYSLNGHPTIMPMLPGLKVEPSDELSHLDKMKIKRMFSHECKKRLVDNVIHRTCARFDELKGEAIPNNNGINGCPTVNGNPGEDIIIPGNDVTLQNDESADDQGIGNEVSDDQSGMNLDVGEDNGPRVIIPGNDVKVVDSGVSDNDAGEDNKILTGNNVNTNEGVSDEGVSDEGVSAEGVSDKGVNDEGVSDDAISGIDMSQAAKPVKQVKKLLGKGKRGVYNYNNIPDDELIVVGYGPNET